MSPGTSMDAAAVAAATQQEEALLETGRSKHHAVMNALRSRLTNYDVCRYHRAIMLFCMLVYVHHLPSCCWLVAPCWLVVIQ